VIIWRSGIASSCQYARFIQAKSCWKSFLLPGGTSQTDFAKRLGWTRGKLNELIKGKRGITGETALDLAEALGTSPRVWMNLQSTFDLVRASASRNAA
jgi:addiction module HigA family antidote